MKCCHEQQCGWTQRIVLSEINQIEKRQIFLVITCMWNLKEKNEQMYKRNQKQTHRYREQTSGYQ